MPPKSELGNHQKKLSGMKHKKTERWKTLKGRKITGRIGKMWQSSDWYPRRSGRECVQRIWVSEEQTAKNRPKKH